MALTIEIEDDKTASVVTLDGEVDAVTVQKFQRALAPLLNKRPANIVLDCSQLRYLNSRAIGLLVQSHRRAMVNDGKLILIGVNDKLMRTLDMGKITDALFLCENREDAIERFDN